MLQTLQTDFAATVWKSGKPKRIVRHQLYPSIPQDAMSIHSLKFVTALIDEAHTARNESSVLHHALRYLCTQACTAVAMTATPIVTYVSDPVALGSLVGIPAFSDPSRYAAEVAPALAAGGKARRDAATARREAAQELIENGRIDVCESESTALDPLTLALAVQAHAIGLLFEGHMIRRTLKDVAGDHELPPLTVKTIFLKPNTWEYAKFLEAINPTTTSSIETGKSGIATQQPVIATELMSKVRRQLQFAPGHAIS